MGWPNTVYVDIPSPYEGLVQYCRCPHCGFVWGHLEIPDRIPPIIQEAGSALGQARSRPAIFALKQSAHEVSNAPGTDH